MKGKNFFKFFTIIFFLISMLCISVSITSVFSYWVNITDDTEKIIDDANLNIGDQKLFETEIVIGESSLLENKNKLKRVVPLNISSEKYPFTNNTIDEINVKFKIKWSDLSLTYNEIKMGIIKISLDKDNIIIENFKPVEFKYGFLKTLKLDEEYLKKLVTFNVYGNTDIKLNDNEFNEIIIKIQIKRALVSEHLNTDSCRDFIARHLAYTVFKLNFTIKVEGDGLV